MKQPMMNRDIKLENTYIHLLGLVTPLALHVLSIWFCLHPLILTSSIHSMADNTLPPVKRERSL